MYNNYNLSHMCYEYLQHVQGLGLYICNNLKIARGKKKSILILCPDMPDSK